MRAISAAGRPDFGASLSRRGTGRVLIGFLCSGCVSEPQESLVLQLVYFLIKSSDFQMEAHARCLKPLFYHLASRGQRELVAKRLKNAQPSIPEEKNSRF